MKRKIGIILVFALVAIMIGSFIKEKIEENQAISDYAMGYNVDLEKEESGITKSQLAPDFTLQNLAGEEVTLSDFRGKNVILNFWTTWCPPCKAEMPHMQKYYDKHGEKDNVIILAVNLTYDSDSEEKVKQFASSYNIDFPILLTQTDTIEKQYKIMTIPSTFFINTEGRIQRQIVGPLDLSALQQYVSEL